MGDDNYGDVDFEAVFRDYSEEFKMSLLFSDQDELFDWAHKKAAGHGFVVVIGRSDNGSRRSAPRMTIACERWGTYKEKSRSLSYQESVGNENLGKKMKNREGLTKKCDCKFQLNAKQVTPDGQWKFKVICGVHNHLISESILGHSYVGRLQKEEEKYVIEMTHANSRPKNILAALKDKYQGNKFVIWTVYNARVKNREKEHAGSSQMQQLMFHLNGHGYYYEYRQCEKISAVNQLFFANPECIKMLKAFPYALFMDLTYKTNRYKLHLLEIVGMTSINMSFLVAAVYLEAEKELNYTWACEILKTMMEGSCLTYVIVTDSELALMNSIRKMFPTTTHLLCRWYISKNIVAKCKKLFDTQESWKFFIVDWNVIVKADTETEFNDLLRRLSKDLCHYPDVLEYVMKQWIVSYKERFVSCWTNKYAL